MDAHETAEFLKDYEVADLNEADTRHQVIDRVLHEVLGWPRALTRCEERVAEGYVDYILYDDGKEPVLIVEAKRTGSTFELPLDANSEHLTRSISLEALLTDETLRAAVEQAQSYASDRGCEFATVTNGVQWVFFRAFAKGKNWRKLRAFVIQSLRWFRDEYTLATNLLSFEALTRRRSLADVLGVSRASGREIYYPKERIDNFTAPVTANRFAKYLRPIANRYFMNLEDAEDDFFEACYVRQREFDAAFTGLSEIIKDSLTPYLEGYGIQQTKDTERGGKFGNRIVRSLRDAQSADVVVLFGGKGIGKSTFLRRLLVHSSPQFLSRHAIVARLDLLNIPEELGTIQTFIWRQLVSQLDVERHLEGERAQLLKLFADRYDVARKQTLFALPEDSIVYNQTLNGLLEKWKLDYEYCASRLASYWRANHRGVVVVLDNTDQYSGSTQDFCFTLAQQIANHLECLALISMREERFHRSRVHGVLDAFQNSGYHLSAPLPHHVFLTRIGYVKKVVASADVAANLPTINPESEERVGLNRFFNILENEFKKGDASPLYTFLIACAHGNIRLALELFRGFLLSGYTNVDEMVSINHLWTLKIHQVVRPLMTPHRFFYEETASQIPNIYQVRSKSKGSHFTALRILNRLAKGADPHNPHFVAVAEVRDVFVNRYDQKDDFEENLDMLLRYVLIEANNRLDHCSPDVDDVRITQYGLYFANAVARDFTYLDLTCTDCGVFSEPASRELEYFANEDHRLFRSFKKLDRVRVRITKVRRFLEYLVEQEKWEVENLHVSEADLVMRAIAESFEETALEVEASAARNVGNE